MKRLTCAILLIAALVAGCGDSEATTEQQAGAAEETTQATEQKALTPEEEKQVLKDTLDTISRNYDIIKSHYENNLKKYDPQVWTDAKNQISSELNTARGKLSESFKAPYSSKETADRVFLLDDMIVKLDSDILPQMQSKLDGSGGDPAKMMGELEKQLETASK